MKTADKTKKQPSQKASKKAINEAEFNAFLQRILPGVKEYSRPDDLMDENAEEFEKVCRNCGSFTNDIYSNEYDFGICMNDVEFDPYIDQVMENGAFDHCRELFERKKFDCNTHTGPDFHYIETVIYKDTDPDTYTKEVFKRARMVQPSEILRELYSKKDDEKVLNYMRSLIYRCNEYAHSCLLEYYRQLGAAQTLEDVHLRIKMVDVLEIIQIEDNVGVYMEEMRRTPVDNRTRQLHRHILDKLTSYSVEWKDKPFLDLISTTKFGPKMMQHIEEAWNYDPDLTDEDRYYLWMMNNN